MRSLFIIKTKSLSAVKFFYGAVFIYITVISTPALSQKSDYVFKKPYPNFNSPLQFSKDTISPTSGNVKFTMKKNPLKAVLYSAVIPGAGQFYNESYWKIPVIAAAGGYFLYEVIKNNNRFIDFRDQYANSQTPENPQGELLLKDLREFYSDQRDNFIIYSVILYAVNLIDAYVDAQLYDFDVSDNIKIRILKKEKIINLGFNF
ncbi:MAG: DUF5683 domain-containing protein [Ignavibacteria bacterium]